jgi:hypothetical protein
LVVLLLKRLILWKHTPGEYPVYSLYYFRWWLVDQLLSTTLPISHALRGTVFLNWWFRLLGADIGPGVRMYTNRLGSVDLVSVGGHSLVQERATLTGHSIHDGILTLRPVAVGWRYATSRVFRCDAISILCRCSVGIQSAVLPNAVLGDAVIIGPLSVVPASTILPPLSSWQGSPLVECDLDEGIVPPYSCYDTLFHLFGFLVLAVVAGAVVWEFVVQLFCCFVLFCFVVFF